MPQTFIEFLVEYAKNIVNETDIIYQKLLDNLEEAHIDIIENKILFNIGQIVKNSAYQNLDLVIRKATNPNVRLGKDSQGKSAIVIDTTDKLPTRVTIVKFLESTQYANKIKEQLKRYFKLHHDYASEVTPSTKYETSKDSNNNFEENYEKLIAKIEAKIFNTKKAKYLLSQQHSQNANTGKQEVLKAAIKNLLSTELGDSFNNFKRVVLKLPEAKFMEHLNPENKKKILSRLESFYEQKFPNFKD